MKEQSINTLFIGKVAIHLNSVNSTNSFAQDLVSKTNPIEGTVIRADEQSAGRGQFGSSWSTQPGENITCSIILLPRLLQAGEQFLLSQTISLAILEFISQFKLSEAVSIKWPNDIYVGKKKIAGILIENILKGIHLHQSIVGLGININQETFDPKIPNPTSLFLLTKKKYDLNQLYFQLYEIIERHYLVLKSGEYEKIRNRYLQNLFQSGLLGNYKIISENRIVEARIAGIDKQGKIELEIENVFRSFGLKEVSFIF
jgi:BirA family biotin operon repressor/biotin-[acetyl-CoA-carboxylase] ligase